MNKVDKDINVPTNDTISRKDAIDATWQEPSYTDPLNVLTEVRDRIKALPSVQPKVAKRIVGMSRDGMTLWYQCDMCNEPVDKQDVYCRGCGRRLIDE